MKSDDIFPGLPTGPNDHETRQDVESQDTASLQTELREQGRIGREQNAPFDRNRVEYPGEGVDGHVRINRDHWGE